MNEGQPLAAEVTNPVGNPGQAICTPYHQPAGQRRRHRGPYSSPNESHDRVRKKEAKYIQNPKAESSTLFVRGNRDKEFSF